MKCLAKLGVGSWALSGTSGDFCLFLCLNTLLALHLKLFRILFVPLSANQSMFWGTG